MFGSSFLWKLYAGYVALILLTSAIVAVLATRDIERDTISKSTQSLHSIATLVDPIAFPSSDGVPREDLQELTRELGTETDIRITVIAADGVVLSDSASDPETMDNHGRRPEILSAGESGRGVARRTSETLRENRLYSALAVHRDGRLVGFVRPSLSLSVIDDNVRALRANVLVATAVASLVALVLGFLVARQVTAPLRKVTHVAESIARGDFGDRVPVAARDEFGQLARAFNRMADELEERLETIETDRRKLQTVMGGMVEGVIAVDGDERVLHFNSVAGRLLETSPGASLGRPIWEVTRVREISEALSRVLEEATEVKSEARVHGAAGERVLELIAAPLSSAEGRSGGAVIVLHDITELIRLEAVRTDFVANVSHELKTPITAIRGFAETLADDPEMDVETRTRFHGKIVEQVARLSILVSDLLALAQLEAKGAGAEKSEVDLRDPLMASARGVLPADQERVRVEIDIPEDPVLVLGDEEALRQLTGNLIDNAVKYTPEGGRVSVRLKAEAGSGIIEVQDSGPGIEPQHQSRVFERFYRVDKARSRELGGTGLGLAIVKHICLDHGGDIDLESHPGRGSLFRVRLPLENGSPR